MANENDSAPRVPGQELHDLARETVAELTSRLGIEGAIVIVIRKTDMMMGCAMKSHTLSLEDAFATGIKGLVDIRQATIKAAQDEAGKVS